MIHAETSKNHLEKHFADDQLTTATKPHTHIHHLNEIMLVVVLHMSKAKYVITYDYIISPLHEVFFIFTQFPSKHFSSF